MVWRAYKKVRSNKGKGWVDHISLEDYNEDLENNLYKLWNRLAPGIYFPSAVREVEIPKKDGKLRKLGIPTISDRIAQQTMKDYLEPRLERVFHKKSYGYRPGRNAHQAIEEVRQHVRKSDWVIDMDIKGFFDEVSHELLMKAIDKHVPENWVKMYTTRWLEAPVQIKNGELNYRDGKGTPQGGVISPLLANLFLHYVFDKWIDIAHPSLNFVRYADDIIIHCSTKQEAELVLKSVEQRMNKCHLRLHEQKTKIVFCKKYRKQTGHSVVKFDFLGYSFQPRPTARRDKKMFLGYDCAISKSSKQKIAETIRSTKFHRWTERSIEEIAEYFNPKLQGWLNYFGKFRIWKLNRIFKIFHERLTNWIRNRFKKLNKSYIKACKWFSGLKANNPELFVHWKYGFINS
jgi:RNA-directed DNA polymerase